MARYLGFLSCSFLLLLAVACGGAGSAGSGGGSGGGGGTSANAPTLTGIAPASAPAGSGATVIIAYGSNFQAGATVLWNGKALATGCLITLNPVVYPSCTTANAIMASIPSSDLASVGTAQVTVSNGGTSTSAAETFTVLGPPAASTWVRTVSGVTVPFDEVWDSVRSKLYVSVATQDPANPNTIAAIDPIAGTISSTVAAGNDPHFLAMSSDSSYLWTSRDGDYAVQRFLLPGLTKDISFTVPLGPGSQSQTTACLQAAPASPHTVAITPSIAGGVYVYDDAVQRPTSVPPFGPGDPEINWIQWGADDSTIYGYQTITMDSGGIGIIDVTSSGASLASYNGGLALQPSISQYDRANGILYSYAGAYDPRKPTLVGQFDISGPDYTCTADSSLGRYFCVDVYSEGGVDVYATELWVFDLNSYALLGRYYFGYLQGESGAYQPDSPVTGAPRKLVRWGNAGLALITTSGAEFGIPVSESLYGAGGVFLIDGAAVNPNAAPDVASGSALPSSYAWLSSMSPQSAAAGSGNVTATITGTGFSQDSTACWNCSFLQFQLLPTQYVSPTELQVTFPVSELPTFEPLEVSVFDQTANLFSSNALTFTVLPSSGTTQVTPMNLSGLAMAWDPNSALLYVGAADYDAAYPNSIVAINPGSGTIVKSQVVEPDPVFLSDGANGEYLYAAYAGATNFTQLALPGLNLTTTGALSDAHGNVWLPGDMKAAPVSPHTTAATLIMPGFSPEALGGIVVYDDGTARPDTLPGWTGGQTVPALYDDLAWGSTDQVLSSAPSGWADDTSGPLYALQVDASGVSYLTSGTATFDTAGGYIHSDFGTGLVYSDGGMVGNPQTGAIVGSYNASGLAAPDSSLNRVFILGQTTSQENTSNYTIESFDEKGYTQVSSITLSNLSGSPIEMVRWGASGLAVLTTGGEPDVYANGFGMLYLIEDSKFVSNLAPSSFVQPEKQELVQQRWKRLSKREALALAHQAAQRRLFCCEDGVTP